MSFLAKVPVAILASRVIGSVDQALASSLGLESTMKSLAIFTTDCDDVGLIALDEATKRADVVVAYAASLYAGAANASTPLAGEFIGMLAGPTPADVQAGLDAAVHCCQHEAAFHYASEASSLIFLAHTVSCVGTYLAREAGILPGAALAYLIAPPLEATFGLDAALKAADVTLAKHFLPPTFTNFAGAWLTGSQASCEASCRAFQEAVLAVACHPIA